MDKTLNVKYRNLLLKNFEYEKNIEKLIQNIIIEDENITSNKYSARIKINFDKKEIINLFRNYKINYTDIISETFLIISSFSDGFNNYGLTVDNPFYNYKIQSNYLNNNLFEFLLPNLSINDRFILPYNKILKHDTNSLSEIANKYKVDSIFIYQINQISENNFNLSIHQFTKLNNEILLHKNYYLNDYSKINEEFFLYVNEWWKDINLIDTSIINTIICTINSNSYEDLINIKSKIMKLSQFKSINLKSISYNENIEEIKFYGDFFVFDKSLNSNKIYIENKNECFIKSIQ